MVIGTQNHYESRASCIGNTGFLGLKAFHFWTFILFYFIAGLAARKLSVGLSPDVYEFVGNTNLLLLIDQD